MNSPREVKVYITSKNGSPKPIKDHKKDTIPHSLGKPSKKDGLKKKESLVSIDSFRNRARRGNWEKRIPLQEPEKNGIRWKMPVNQPLPYRKSSYMQFILSIFGAVGVGAVMGLSILSLFFSHPPKHSTTDVSVAKTQSRVSMPPLRIVMLQAGSFLEREGAEKVVKEYQSRGIGVFMSHTSPFRVFLGVAVNDSEAQRMVELYKKQSIDVYRKELNATYDFTLTPDQFKLKDALLKGHALLRLASEKSLGSMVTGSNMAKDQELVRRGKEFYQEYQNVAPMLPKEAQGSFAQMNQALKQVVEGEKVQEALAQYVISYKELAELLK